MGRNVPHARRKRADALPLCIFTEGQKKGIRCATVEIFKVANRDVKICNYAGCAYNESPLY